jgi:hypothetical protein
MHLMHTYYTGELHTGRHGFIRLYWVHSASCIIVHITSNWFAAGTAVDQFITRTLLIDVGKRDDVLKEIDRNSECVWKNVLPYSGWRQ